MRAPLSISVHPDGYPHRIGRVEAGATRIQGHDRHSANLYGIVTWWEGALRVGSRIIWRCGHEHADRAMGQKCSRELIRVLRAEAVDGRPGLST